MKNIAPPGNVAVASPGAARSASVDLLKAVSIFGVVWIHGSYLIPFSPSYQEWLSPLFRFCVPVFIFLWAYFCDRALARRSGSAGYLAQRLGRLAVPFVFWSAIYFWQSADFAHLTLAKAVTTHWSGYGWSGQYFFIILFQLTILFPVFRAIAALGKPVVIATVVLGFAGYLALSYGTWARPSFITKLGDRPFIYWLPVVFAGIGASRGWLTGWRIPLWLAAITPVLMPLEFQWLHPATIGWSPYLTASALFATLALGLSALRADWTYGQLGPVSGKIVGLLSRETLGIFCLNPLFVLLLRPSLGTLHFQFPGAGVIVPLTSTVLVLLLCLSLIAVLRKLRLGVLISG